MVFNWLFNIIFLVLAIPIGYLIAYWCKDELVDGRKWFRILIIVSIIGALGFYLFGFSYISLTFGFILIVSLISLIKSNDKGLIKRR
ncbi:hypothetical protein J4217_01150 [Candidatus Pacearchaeota archaeon]|nr:hypothetical protein [Candidatus Pacearchaeota archaeon]